jgi:hypothetical protein
VDTFGWKNGYIRHGKGNNLIARPAITVILGGLDPTTFAGEALHNCC